MAVESVTAASDAANGDGAEAAPESDVPSANGSSQPPPIDAGLGKKRSVGMPTTPALHPGVVVFRRGCGSMERQGLAS
jgi:hypothetical protein